MNKAKLESISLNLINVKLRDLYEPEIFNYGDFSIHLLKYILKSTCRIEIKIVDLEGKMRRDRIRRKDYLEYKNSLDKYLSVKNEIEKFLQLNNQLTYN